MASKPKPQGDLIGPIVMPGTVRADMKKTKAFIDELSKEIAESSVKNAATATPEQKQFFVSYLEWRKRFDAWYADNSNETWSPMQVLSTSAIANQNDAWRKEGEERQATFRGFGFASATTPPKPSPGAPDAPGTPGVETFLSGVGSGTIIALLVVVYLASDSGRGRRRR